MNDQTKNTNPASGNPASANAASFNPASARPVNPAVDPSTRRKLAEFARRRRRLIVLRGVCAGLLSLIAGMLVVAAADYLLVLEDEVRWALSGAAYAAAGAAVWMTCGRMMVKLPTERGLARLMEAQEPGLREELLSAVELGDERSDAGLDSATFRALLQERVARRVSGLEVRSLLPTGLVRQWVRWAGGVAGLCAVLWMLPGSPMGVLMTRAMLPLADVERVSRTRVVIVEPVPMDAVVPEGDGVRVAVELSGEEADRVEVELWPVGGERRRMVMGREEGRRYAAVVQMGDEPVVYRVRAGDGMTLRHTIVPEARPAVTGFVKTYRPPSYTRMEPSVVNEAEGHVSGIEGTVVELAIAVNQPVSRAELRMEVGGRMKVVPLRMDGPRMLGATVELREPGVYQVGLVAERTKFDNRFSPKYEISVAADVAPRVVLEEPTPREPTQLLPADEMLGLRGEATDDLGLVKVEQMIRINGGRWAAVELARDAGKAVTVERTWDLFEHGLKAGDRLETKLVARDLKGAASESEVVTIVVTSQGFAADRLGPLTAKIAARNALIQLRGVAEGSRRGAEEAQQKLDRLEPSDPQAALYVANFTEAIDAVAQEMERVRRVIEQTMPRMRRGTDAMELAAMGYAADRIEHEMLAEAKHHWGAARLEQDRQHRNEAMRHALNEVRNAAGEARWITDRAEYVVMMELADVAISDVTGVLGEQQRIVRLAQGGGGGASGDGRLAQMMAIRRQVVAFNQVLAVAKMLEESARQLQDGTRERLRDRARVLTEACARIEKVGPTIQPGDGRIAEEAQKFADDLVRWLHEMKGLHRDLARRVVDVRRELTQRYDDLHGTLYRVGDGAREVVRRSAEMARKRAAGETVKEDRASRLADKVAELTEVAWPGTVEMLRSRMALAEKRPDAPSQLAADAGVMARALVVMQGRMVASLETGWTESRDVGTQVHELAGAWRLLERVAEVAEAAAIAGEVVKLEQWEAGATGAAVTVHGRQWDQVAEAMSRVPHRLREAGASHEAARIIEQAQQSDAAKAVAQEMTHRRGGVHEPMPMDKPAAQVKAELDRALVLLRQDAEKARRMIHMAAPTVAQLMDRAAEQTKRLGQKMEEAIKKAEDAAKNGDKAQEQQAQAKAQAQGQTPEQGQTQTQDQAEQAKAEAQAAERAAAAEREAAQAAVQEVRREQQQLREELAEIVEALRQDANVQDAMQEEGRERARDADDATAMLRDPANRMQEAVEQAASAAEPTDQAAAMKQANEKREQLEQMLAQLSEHYEKLEAGEPVAQSRSAMREAEKELGIKGGLDEAYEQAERLAELARLSPQEMLKELERELGVNEPMRRELSQISRQAAAEAQRQLEQAGEQQAAAAQQVAQMAKDQERAEREADAQVQQLRQEAAKLAQEQIPAAHQKARDAQSAKAADKAAAAKQAAENAQKRLAEVPKDDGAEQASETAQKISEAAKELDAAREHLDAARKELAEQAADKSAPASPEQAGEQAAERAAQQAAEKAAAKAATDAASMATEQAAGKADELAKKARETAEKLAQQEPKRRYELAKAADDQQAIGEAVEQARQDVERAARHEQRLKNEAGAQQLEQAADQVEQSAQKSVEKAAAKLGDAKEPADAQEAVTQSAEAIREAAKAVGQLAESTPQSSAQRPPQPSDPAQPQDPAPAPAQSSDPSASEPSATSPSQASAQAKSQSPSQPSAQSPSQSSSQPSPQSPSPSASPSASPSPMDPAAAAQQSPAPSPQDTAAAPSPADQPAPSASAAASPPPSPQSPADPSSAASPSAPSQPEASAAEPSDSPRFPGASATWLARALDQLDERLAAQAAQADQAQSDQQQGTQGQQADASQPGDSGQSPSNSPSDQSPGSPGSPGSPTDAQAQGQNPGQNPAQGQSPGDPSQAQGQTPGEAGQSSASASSASSSSSSSSASSPSSAMSSVAAAMEAAAASMRQSRMNGNVPGDGPMTPGLAAQSDRGAQVKASAKAYDDPGKGRERKDGEWGRLPAQMAKDLMEGRREGVDGEYRNMVETYFKVIAEQAGQAEGRP